MRRLVLFVVGLTLIVSVPARAQVVTPPYSTPPTMQAFQATGLSMPYTIGIGTVGGSQLVIPAGTLTLTDNQYSCAAPQFPACNIVYWPGVGTTLLVTSLPQTAFLTGTSVVAYITTSGGAITGVTTAAATLQIPGGVPVLGWYNAANTGGLRLPICNSLVKAGCQANSGSLSGY